MDEGGPLPAHASLASARSSSSGERRNIYRREAARSGPIHFNPLADLDPTSRQMR
jgi:hypothetical protein